jgi:hypothetical protein
METNDKKLLNFFFSCTVISIVKSRGIKCMEHFSEIVRGAHLLDLVIDRRIIPILELKYSGLESDAWIPLGQDRT